MIVTCKWTTDMQFETGNDTHRIAMDAKKPIGRDMALTPKELILSGLCGCTAMDVIALLKKHKQPVETFSVSVDAPLSEGHPKVFTQAILVFELTGQLEADRVKESVVLSQTKYCSVTAMLEKAFPISYKIKLNGVEIAEGGAGFSS